MSGPAAAPRETRPTRGAGSGGALDRRSPLPLYAQVKRRLQGMILAGEYPGERFHSEPELCVMFGISRATVRQAIRELVDDGFLTRVQGQGTFVNRDKFDEAFGPSMNFIDQWASVGRPLRFAVRRFQLARVPSRIAKSLGVPAEAEALCIERARWSGQLIVSYDYRYIHPDFARTVDAASAAEQSLLEILARRVRLVRGENKVEAALAGREGARLLEVSASDPVLIREMTYYCRDGVPVMAGRSLYRADQVRYAFTVLMDGDAPDAGPNVRSRVETGRGRG
jgi:GntR family transcriptional regulator